MNTYKYHDGQRERFGDPMRINRLLYAYLDGNPKAVTTKAKSPIPEESLPAMDQLLEAGRKAFELVPFNPETGEGATEDVILPLITDFWTWSKEQKKNAGGSPTSPGPTDSPVSSPSQESLQNLPTWAQPSSASG